MSEFNWLHSDAMKWNGRYQTEGKKWQSSCPRQLLLAYADLLPGTGLALDAAAGVGVHGLFLAARGWHVIALDISEVGLRLAREQALARGVCLETAVFDLNNPWLPANSFDVILNFRFLARSTFPVYRQALKPGGWLLFETFVQVDDHVKYPDHYLKPGELFTAFSDFDMVHMAQVAVRGQGRGKMRQVEQLVARKQAMFS
ncbi:MAG: SAM-dependent methyltransferase [Chloroflexi bacterium]|nr:MAG: SAM-dependent methyltransferase [Chloroflexota bacterium]PIE80930.1 MAG: SAM-dependent methyltransferase [Chloroflexota bacterium]